MLQSITNWLIAHGIKIIIIIILGIVLDKIIDRAADKAIEKFVIKKQKNRDKEEIKQRVDTLTDVLNATTSVVIFIIVLLMILPEFGMAVGPLLAGAGIVGLAVGFGAQNLVRDVLSGIFIIIEDQYAIGDVVGIGEVRGTVEILNLRRTVLRDIDGIQHHIPNGEIKVASNYTKDWSRINLEIPVSYSADIDNVTKIRNRVGKEIAEDSEYKDFIMEAPKVLGLDKFGDSEVILKILGKTKPLKQWDITRELRKRIKKTFDQEGIEIPFPQRVIHQQK